MQCNVQECKCWLSKGWISIADACIPNAQFWPPNSNVMSIWQMDWKLDPMTQVSGHILWECTFWSKGRRICLFGHQTFPLQSAFQTHISGEKVKRLKRGSNRVLRSLVWARTPMQVQLDKVKPAQNLINSTAHVLQWIYWVMWNHWNHRNHCTISE